MKEKRPNYKEERASINTFLQQKPKETEAKDREESKSKTVMNRKGKLRRRSGRRRRRGKKTKKCRVCDRSFRRVVSRVGVLLCFCYWTIDSLFGLSHIPNFQKQIQKTSVCFIFIQLLIFFPPRRHWQAYFSTCPYHPSHTTTSLLRSKSNIVSSVSWRGRGSSSLLWVYLTRM